jgi:hypothetical protein
LRSLCSSSPKSGTIAVVGAVVSAVIVMTGSP